MSLRPGILKVLVVAALLCAVAFGAVAVSGCAASPQATQPTAAPSGGVSALAAFQAAFGAIKTSVPDSKFLLVQTTQIATTSPPPTWSYLFASKSKNKIYLVSVNGGRATAPSEMGTATLKPVDFDKIPTPAAWTVDSTKAYEAAVAAFKERYKTDAPAEYAMGLATFVPNANSGIKPFVWSVTFAPTAADKGKPKEIMVNATTGEVVPAAK